MSSCLSKIRYASLPLVALYFKQKDKATLLNTRVEKAPLLDRIGNFFLTPSQFLLKSQTYTLDKDRNVTSIHQTFGHTHRLAKTITAIATLILFPWVIALGLSLKAISLCISPQSRSNYCAVYNDLHSTTSSMAHSLRPHMDRSEHYQALGVQDGTIYSNDYVECENIPRKLNIKDEVSFNIDKAAAKAAIDALTEYNIPVWFEYGTLLGAIRHGDRIPWDKDMDLAILTNDFDDVRRILTAKLDPKKYELQDWSDPSLPKQGFKIYVKENRSLIDIYTYRIGIQGRQPEEAEEEHPLEQRTLTFPNGEKKEVELVNKDKVFQIHEGEPFVQYQFSEDTPMPESWKVRERAAIRLRRVDALFPLKKVRFGEIEGWAPNQTKDWLKCVYGVTDPSKVWVPNDPEDETKGGHYQPVQGHPYWDTNDPNSILDG